MSGIIASNAIAAIDSRIAERGLLRHPFYQSWTKGELDLPTLRDYAMQYYQHVAAFPTYLSAVHSRTEDQVTRKHLLDNLAGPLHVVIRQRGMHKKRQTGLT